VFLEGIDLKKSKSWDHPPVRVEQRGQHLRVHQGAVVSRIGFVYRGDPVEMVSKDRRFHSLHADGAAFFTLTFPDPNRPRVRRFSETGLVELTSAAGYFWMRAYLFVADHPYYTRTDARGHFTLPDVPPGRYCLVAWLPNWHMDHHERDSETGSIVRWYFTAPVRWSQPVVVKPGRTAQVGFRFEEKDFRPKP
jgi:hypothetical protein